MTKETLDQPLNNNSVNRYHRRATLLIIFKNVDLRLLKDREKSVSFYPAWIVEAIQLGLEFQLIRQLAHLKSI